MTEQKTLWDLIDKQKSTIILIGGVVAFFFWQVVIPIQKIQGQLAGIQAQLTNIQNQKLESRLTTIETKLDAHLNPK